MAVQAEYPSDVLVLPETSCNRMRNLNEEERNFVRSAAFNVDVAVPDFKMLPVAAAAALDGVPSRPLQSFSLEGSMHAMATRWPSYAAMPEISPSPNMWMCRRESDEPLNFLPLEGIKATSLNLQPKSCDFTGLRLSVQEDHSNATSRKESNNNNILCASNNLAAEIQRQRDEMEHFIRLQEEGMRRNLVERTENHSKALLCAAAAAVTRKLQEKDLELLHLKRKNVELEEQIRGLEFESRAWQKRAKSSETMAATLKLQIDQINKEGSGDSEEEAINTAMANVSSSSFCQVIPSNNNNIYKNIYMENLVLEMQRKCRVCRTNEVCILLLPCRHLCLCKHCDCKVDVCPLCSALKTASVQVQIT